MKRPDSEETKEHLLKSAKAEFLEKGFAKASLRTICKNADVTTGALYFFFKDKEAIFDAIVGPLVEELLKILEGHMAEEQKAAREGRKADDKMGDDNYVSNLILDIVYKDHDIVLLLLEKSGGSKYEKFSENLVVPVEEHYRYFLDEYSKRNNLPRFSDYISHWLAHTMVESFIQLFQHFSTKEEARKVLPDLVKMNQGAAFGVLGMTGTETSARPVDLF